MGRQGRLLLENRCEILMKVYGAAAVYVQQSLRQHRYQRRILAVQTVEEAAFAGQSRVDGQLDVKPRSHDLAGSLRRQGDCLDFAPKKLGQLLRQQLPPNRRKAERPMMSRQD